MVREITPAGTSALSSPSRSMSRRRPLQAAGGRAGHRPDRNAWAASGPIVLMLVNSPLEAEMQLSASSPPATHTVAPPEYLRPMRYLVSALPTPAHAIWSPGRRRPFQLSCAASPARLPVSDRRPDRSQPVCCLALLLPAYAQISAERGVFVGTRRARPSTPAGLAGTHRACPAYLVGQASGATRPVGLWLAAGAAWWLAMGAAWEPSSLTPPRLPATTTTTAAATASGAYQPASHRRG